MHVNPSLKGWIQSTSIMALLMCKVLYFALFKYKAHDFIAIQLTVKTKIKYGLKVKSRQHFVLLLTTLFSEKS